MKNNDIKNSDFENMLKSKMDELASSVDCFDRISKRAFPESSAEYSDSEYTICDLENVTGKKRTFRFIPALAIAAAVALCVFFLPKSDNFMNFVYSNIGKSDNETFREIIYEIKEETENYTYEYHDYTLDEYIKNDLLITPLQSCPFEVKNKDSINVRIFTKMCGVNYTNQVYAVEYEGDYEDGNFIAAADSKAKFTDEELENFKDQNKAYGFSSNCVKLSLNDGILADAEGNPIIAAEFSYRCLYKYNNDSFMLESQVIYYHSTKDAENTSYFYDITGNYLYNGYLTSQLDDTALNDVWNNVVYYNGTSAKAEDELSNFHKADIYCDSNESELSTMELLSLRPFAVVDEEKFNADMKDAVITIYGKNDRTIGNILPPINTDLRFCFVIHTSDAGEDITVTSSDGTLDLEFPYNLLINGNSSYVNNFSSGLTEEQAAAQFEEAKLKAAEEQKLIEYDEDSERLEKEESEIQINIQEEENAANAAEVNNGG